MGPRLFRRGNFLEYFHRHSGTRGFNGATPFQAWKPGVDFELRCRVVASMGPRLFRRGNIMVAGMLDQMGGLQWGHAFSGVETKAGSGTTKTVFRASMGPRLFRRGNKMITKKMECMNKLQWGHAFSGVETDPGYPVSYNLILASMGPRLFRRGNSLRG